MSGEHAGNPSIVEVLTGRAARHPLVKISPAQRLYYNYHLDQPSFAAEVANVGRPPAPRDFRTRRQRDEDA